MLSLGYPMLASIALRQLARPAMAELAALAKVGFALAKKASRNQTWFDRLARRVLERVLHFNFDLDEMVLYYQINYTLTEIPDDAAYFHAQFRRTNPLP